MLPKIRERERERRREKEKGGGIREVGVEGERKGLQSFKPEEV